MIPYIDPLWLYIIITIIYKNHHYSGTRSSYLQCTVIGPSWPNCSLVLCTWPMKSMNPSPDFGTPCSGQSVNWNWRTVLDWPSCVERRFFFFLNLLSFHTCLTKGQRIQADTHTQWWLTLASVTLNSRRMYWGMLYSAMGSTTKYWYLAERSAGQYWWHFSCRGGAAQRDVMCK